MAEQDDLLGITQRYLNGEINYRQFRNLEERWLDEMGALRTGPTTQEYEHALVLAYQLSDATPCWYDHHGYCQEHGWLRDGPCPNGQAEALIAKLQREGRLPLALRRMIEGE